MPDAAVLYVGHCLSVCLPLFLRLFLTWRSCIGLQANESRMQSLAWAKTNSAQFIGALMGAIGTEIQKHVAEQQAKTAKKD